MGKLKPGFVLWWDAPAGEYVARAMVQGRFDQPSITAADRKPGKALKLLRKALRQEGLL